MLKVHPWVSKIGLNTFLFLNTESFGCQETRDTVVVTAMVLFENIME